MRKRRAEKRDVLPDPLYNSKLVTKLVNRLMKDCKKGVAQTILYDSFDIVDNSASFLLGTYQQEHHISFSSLDHINIVH